VAFLVTSVMGIILVGNSLYAYLIAFLFGAYLGISDTVQRAIIPDFVKKGVERDCICVLLYSDWCKFTGGEYDIRLPMD